MTFNMSQIENIRIERKVENKKTDQPSTNDLRNVIAAKLSDRRTSPSATTKVIALRTHNRHDWQERHGNGYRIHFVGGGRSGGGVGLVGR